MPSARQVFSASIVLMLGFVAAASIMVAPEWADAASADTIRLQPQLYTQDEDSEPRLADTLEFEPLPLHSQDEDSEVRLRDQQGVGPRDPAMEPFAGLRQERDRVQARVVVAPERDLGGRA